MQPSPGHLRVLQILLQLLDLSFGVFPFEAVLCGGGGVGVGGGLNGGKLGLQSVDLSLEGDVGSRLFRYGGPEDRGIAPLA